MREKHGLSLEALGSRLGVGRSYLSLLENQKREKPSALFTAMICQTYNVRREWLLDGLGSPFDAEYLNRAAEAGTITGREVPEPITLEERAKSLALLVAALLMAGNRTKDGLARALVDVLKNPLPLPAVTIEAARLIAEELHHGLHASKRPGASLGIKTLSDVLADGTNARRTYESLLRDTLEQKLSQKQLLTSVAASGKLSPVKSQLKNLLADLNRLTKESGKKTELAEFLGAPLTSVSRWLSGEREPGGETTLRLFHWVKQQERQPNTPGSATNTAKGQTQVSKTSYDKPTKVRKKE